MGRKYDAVFKEEAVKLSDEIGLPDAANRLGIPYQTLSEWRKKRTRPGVVNVDGSKAHAAIRVYYTTAGTIPHKTDVQGFGSQRKWLLQMETHI